MTIGNPKRPAAFSGVVLLFLLAHFAHHLVTALPAPLMPLIREEFNLDYAQAGLLLSAFSLTYGISQLPAGWIADHIGARLSLTIGICGVALAGFGVGLSHTYILMIVFLLLMGVLGGGYHPSSPALISASVDPKNRGRAFGFHSIGGSSSFFIAPVVAAAVSAVWGWRAPFIALSIPTIVYGAVFYLLLHRIVKPNAAIAKSAGNTAVAATPQSKGGLAAFLTANAMSHAALLSVVSFLPLFAVDRFGIPKEAGGVFISLYYGAGLLASLLGGYLSDRFGSVRVMLTVCFLCVPTIYLLGLAPSMTVLGIIAVVLGILSYINMPTSEAHVVTHTTESRRSSVLGIMYFINIEGVTVFTFGLGYFIERSGFSLSVAIAAAAVLVTTLVCAFWLRTRR